MAPFKRLYIVPPCRPGYRHIYIQGARQSIWQARLFVTPVSRRGNELGNGAKWVIDQKMSKKKKKKKKPFFFLNYYYLIQNSCHLIFMLLLHINKNPPPPPSLFPHFYFISPIELFAGSETRQKLIRGEMCCVLAFSQKCEDSAMPIPNEDICPVQSSFLYIFSSSSRCLLHTQLPFQQPQKKNESWIEFKKK